MSTLVRSRKSAAATVLSSTPPYKLLASYTYYTRPAQSHSVFDTANRRTKVLPTSRDVILETTNLCDLPRPPSGPIVKRVAKPVDSYCVGFIDLIDLMSFKQE